VCFVGGLRFSLCCALIWPPHDYRYYFYLFHEPLFVFISPQTVSKIFLEFSVVFKVSTFVIRGSYINRVFNAFVSIQMQR
jgi:hypothetical protein